MNEKSWVGATSWYHCVAEDSKIQKCRSLTLSKHLFIRKLKKTALHGLSSPNPNFSEFAFFGKYICRLGIVDFNLPSNWWVSLLEKSEFSVVLLGFEKLGLGLDNRGRTTNKACCCIYSLWFEIVAVIQFVTSKWFSGPAVDFKGAKTGTFWKRDSKSIHWNQYLPNFLEILIFLTSCPYLKVLRTKVLCRILAFHLCEHR